MPKDDFEKQLDIWVKHEVDSAPDLHPTPEMIRRVASKRKPGVLSFFPSRQAWAGLSVVAMIILLAGYFFVMDLELLQRPEAGDQVAFLIQHPLDLPGEIAGTLQTPPPEKGRGKGAETMAVLAFQIYRPNLGQVDTIDLRKLAELALVLSHQDHFRVLLQSGSTRFFYLYQINPAGVPTSLHPDTGFIFPDAGTLAYLPDQPDWFTITGETGEYRLEIIASPYKLNNLENLYLQSLESHGTPREGASQAALQAYLDNLHHSPSGQIQLWELRIEYRE